MLMLGWGTFEKHEFGVAASARMRDGAGMAYSRGRLSGDLTTPQAVVVATNAQLDACMAKAREWIPDDADLAGIDAGDLERQIRLHLPSIDRQLLHGEYYKEAYAQVLPTARERATTIRLEHSEVASGANMKLLADADYICRRDLWLEATEGPSLRLRFDDVDPVVGRRYQERLHYLRAARDDTSHHFGLYLADAELPMAYVAVSPCDRRYMINGLPVDGYGIEDVVVLTRMHGLPGLPGNVMSLMTKHVIRALKRQTNARIILTAYNPLLGFRGAVYRASGFTAFATAPVAYGYDERGEYTTRRQGKSARLSELNTPPNVLMARGLDQVSQCALARPKSIGRISESDYWADIPPAPDRSAEGTIGRKLKRLHQLVLRQCVVRGGFIRRRRVNQLVGGSATGDRGR
jgi:hypothetical protein